MKIYIDLPWGGKLRIELGPVEANKVYAICGCIAGCVVVVAFFSALR